jgi:hypothetical protein
MNFSYLRVILYFSKYIYLKMTFETCQKPKFSVLIVGELQLSGFRAPKNPVCEEDKPWLFLPVN